jgi:heavy metal sensor kinase
MTVRTRLTLWYAMTLAVVLFAFAAGLLALQRQRLFNALDEQLAEDKEVAEQLLERTADGRMEMRSPAHGGEPPLGFSLVAQALDGAILFASPQASSAAPSPEWTGGRTLGSGDAAARVFSDPETIDGTRVVLHVSRAEAPLRAQLAELFWLSFGLLPAGVLLAAAGGWLLARKALRPVAQMADQAGRVSAERLGERLTIANPADEFGRLGEAFNATLERLERSFDQLRRFTADASHELRTPLTALRSVGEVGLRTAGDLAGHRDVIASMLEEAERLTGLVDTLLLLARSEGGALPLTPSSFDLRDLAREVAGTLGILAEEKRLRIAVTGDAATVHGDRTLLRQVLLNLLHNAIRHSPPGGAIALEISREGGSARCALRDEGPGVPRELRARVFERFFRGDDARDRARGGAGLGLAVARAIVELHRGTLTLAERDGQGAEFIVRLPHENLAA